VDRLSNKQLIQPHKLR